jgi:hypothetical protein
MKEEVGRNGTHGELDVDIEDTMKMGHKRSQAK